MEQDGDGSPYASATYEFFEGTYIMNTKNKIINRTRYWLIIGFLAMVSVAANAGGGNSKPATSGTGNSKPTTYGNATKDAIAKATQLPGPLLNMVMDYHDNTQSILLVKNGRLFDYKGQDNWHQIKIARFKDEHIKNQPTVYKAVMDTAGTIIALVKNEDNIIKLEISEDKGDTFVEMDPPKDFTNINPKDIKLKTSANGKKFILYDRVDVFASDSGEEWSHVTGANEGEIKDVAFGKYLVVLRANNLISRFDLTPGHLQAAKVENAGDLCSYVLQHRDENRFSCEYIKLAVNNRNTDFVLFGNRIETKADGTKKNNYFIQTSYLSGAFWSGVQELFTGKMTFGGTITHVHTLKADLDNGKFVMIFDYKNLGSTTLQTALMYNDDKKASNKYLIINNLFIRLLDEEGRTPVPEPTGTSAANFNDNQTFVLSKSLSGSSEVYESVGVFDDALGLKYIKIPNQMPTE